MLLTARSLTFVALFFLCSTVALRGSVVQTIDLPELTGTFVHGQEPIVAEVDFGFNFQPLWSIKLEITATGHPGHEGAVALPVDLIVTAHSVDTPTGHGMTWVPPTTLGPYGQASSTHEVIEPFAWVAVFPLPITSGQGFVTIDTPPDAINDDFPSYLNITSAKLTAEYLPEIGPCGPFGCDGFVGIDDLNGVLGNWNQHVNPGDYTSGDLSGDGYIGIDDLNAVLSQWNAGTPPGSNVVSESGALLDEDSGGFPVCDGIVGICYLNIVLGSWNQAVPPGDALADISGDGFVGIDDLSWVLSHWNTVLPPSANPVPEPAALGLLSLGTLTVLNRRLIKW